MSRFITILPHMPSWLFLYIVYSCCWSLNFHFNACNFGFSFAFLAQFSVPFTSNCKAMVLPNVFYVIVKVTFHPITGHEYPEREQMYSFVLSLTSALGGMGGQRHVPGALLPGKTRYPLYSRLGGPQGRSGRMRKIRSHRDSIPGPSGPQRSPYTD